MPNTEINYTKIKSFKIMFFTINLILIVVLANISYQTMKDYYTLNCCVEGKIEKKYITSYKQRNVINYEIRYKNLLSIYRYNDDIDIFKDSLYVSCLTDNYFRLEVKHNYFKDRIFGIISLIGCICYLSIFIYILYKYPEKINFTRY